MVYGYEAFGKGLEIIGALFLIAGCMDCFLGYQLFKFFIKIRGFFVGAVIGFFTGIILGAIGGEDAAFVISIISAIIFGILGAVLANALYYITVFLSSGITVFVIGFIFIIAGGGDGGSLLMVLFLAVTAGIVSCIFTKYQIIIKTSASGAFKIALALSMFAMAGREPESAVVAIGVLSLIFFLAVGIAFQTYLSRRKKEDSNNENISEIIQKTKSLQEPETLQEPRQERIPESIQEAKREPDRLLLGKLFSDEVCREMKYVFPTAEPSQMKYMPQISEDKEEWMCSCGNTNTKEECIYCGMKRAELAKKMNYQYLKEHQSARLEQEKQDKKKKQEELIAKAKAEKDKVKVTIGKIFLFIKKVFGHIGHWIVEKRKLLILIVSVILAVGLSAVLLTKNPKVRSKYYLWKAERTENLREKTGYYMQSINANPNLQAYEAMIDIYLEHEMYIDAVETLANSVYNEHDFREDPEFTEYAKKLYPAMPVFNEPEGEYKERITVSLSLGEENSYQPELFYTVNDGAVCRYTTPIELSEVGDYTIKAWIENAIGYDSEKAAASYRINLIVPDDVSFSVAGGSFTNEIDVELSSGDAEVYYTLDEARPSKASYVYTGPIHCPFGTTIIRAVSYSTDDVESSIGEETYHISYPDDNRTGFGSVGLSGYYYDYLMVNGVLNIYDKNSDTVLETISDCNTEYGDLNEYNDSLYYISKGGGIMRYDLKTMNQEVVCEDVEVLHMILVHDSIYYNQASDRKLYRMDVDGSRNTIVSSSCITGMFRNDNTLYVLTAEDGVWRYDEKDAPPVQILTEAVGNMALINDKMYYIKNNALYQLEDGMEKEIISEIRNETYEEPGFIRKGYTDHHWEQCRSLQISNKSLIVEKYVEYYMADISNLNKKPINEEIDRHTEYLIYNTDTGEIVMSERANSFFMMDNAYYKDGQRVQYEH